MSLAFAAVLFGATLQFGDFAADAVRWRDKREASLKRDGGWLSVAGLFWLRPGENSVGSAASNAVRLPSGPGVVGDLRVEGDRVSMTVAPGVALTVNGKSRDAGGLIATDATGPADLVGVGSLTFKVIKRGKRLGVRLYDPNCPGRTNFKGLDWFAPNEAFAIRAKFVPFEKPRQMMITNILGDTEPAISPGYAEFNVGDVRCRLEAQSEGDGLFFNFRDATSGQTTYGAGRFLDTDGPKDGMVVMDFNRAVNPPCAFTDFATCPLPPKGNQLSAAIEAGEKRYGH